MVRRHLTDGPGIGCAFGTFHRPEQEGVSELPARSAKPRYLRQALVVVEFVVGAEVGETCIERFVLVSKRKDGVQKRRVDFCVPASVLLIALFPRFVFSLSRCICSTLLVCWHKRGGTYDGR